MQAMSRARAGRALVSVAFVVAAALATVVGPCPSPARAQDEARSLFERGNEHLARGLRARGRARERELSEAVDAYLGVLRLGARTRNVVFNLGLANEGLERREEAFNYFGEYVRAFELGPDERAEGLRRVEALRPRVAVVLVESTPAGSEVRVGRSDLPVRGSTPLELALPPGPQVFFVSRAGFEESRAETTAVTGTSARVAVTLAARPVDVQVIAPGTGRLTLDGEAIEAGRTHPVQPGAHVVRLELPGVEPTERRFEVAPGDEPLLIELSGPAGRSLGGRVRLTVDRPAEVFVAGVRLGVGTEHDVGLPAGLHELRVTARGSPSLEHSLRVEPSQDAHLAIDLGQLADATGLDAARAVLTTFTILTAGAAAASIGQTVSLWDQWNAGLARQTQGSITPEELDAIASQLDQANLASDVIVGAALALGVGMVVTFAVGPEGGREPSVRLAASGAPGGGAVTLAWRTP
jgi:hypothetical protein